LIDFCQEKEEDFTPYAEQMRSEDDPFYLKMYNLINLDLVQACLANSSQICLETFLEMNVDISLYKKLLDLFET